MLNVNVNKSKMILFERDRDHSVISVCVVKNLRSGGETQRPVLNHLHRKFKEKFLPFQNLCIDESILWKGILGFKKYCTVHSFKMPSIWSDNLCICILESDFIHDSIISMGKRD